jgi:hypothetical protein
VRRAPSFVRSFDRAQSAGRPLDGARSLMQASKSRLPLTLEADGRTAVLNALESGAAASVVAHDPTTSLRTRPCQVPHTGVHAPRGSSYSYSPSSEPLLSALLESTFGPTLLQYPSAPEGWFGKRGGQPCGLLLLSLPM